MKDWRCDGVCVRNQRPSNMDSIFCGKRELASGPLILAVVCDGVGSTRDGAFASGYCTKSLEQWFRETDGNRLGLALRDRVLGLNHEIIAETGAQGLNAATTLSALLITRNGYVAVHAGDSRIYRCDTGGLFRLTQDDVSEQGRLTACIGRWEDLIVHYEEGEMTDGIFLLCSDGLYKHVEENQLQQELAQGKGRRQKRTLTRLVKLAVDQGETDNISAILLQNRKRGTLK